MARRHRALETKIEILRRILAEMHWPIVENGFGMGDAGFEGERIDERLQRRAGRAQRLGHIDRAGARCRKIIRAADMGANFACRIVDDENGDGNFRAEPLRALMRQLFQRGLPAGRERQTMRAMLLVGAQRRLGGMRRQMRKSETPVRHVSAALPRHARRA